jgi:hypothetical protein
VRFSGGAFSKPQLERASSATEFAARHRQQELGLCQRYYQKSYDLGVAPNANDSAGCRAALSNNAGTFTTHVDFATRMRVAPTITLYGPVGGASALSTGSSIGESGFHVTQVGGATNSNTRFHFVADAEI